MKPKIFAFIQGESGWGLHVVALAEDGTGLAGHLCSNIGFAKHDIGITSDWKHDAYDKHYPEGYEIVWLDDPDSNSDFQLAIQRNHEVKS